jgi:hypothetical protein
LIPVKKLIVLILGSLTSINNKFNRKNLPPAYFNDFKTKDIYFKHIKVYFCHYKSRAKLVNSNEENVTDIFLSLHK